MFWSRKKHVHVRVVGQGIAFGALAEEAWADQAVGYALAYNSEDPLAFTFSFGMIGQSVDWSFGRSLLTDALYKAPSVQAGTHLSGIGDLQIWKGQLEGSIVIGLCPYLPQAAFVAVDEKLLFALIRETQSDAEKQEKHAVNAMIKELSKLRN